MEFVLLIGGFGFAIFVNDMTCSCKKYKCDSISRSKA